MKRSFLLLATVACLIGASGPASGMGSGPHPHLQSEMPPAPPKLSLPPEEAAMEFIRDQQHATTDGVVMAAGVMIFLGLMIATVRSREGAP